MHGYFRGYWPLEIPASNRPALAILILAGGWLMNYIARSARRFSEYENAVINPQLCQLLLLETMNYE